jgi:hypothetical protein
MGVFSEINRMLNDGATIPQLQIFIMSINKDMDKWRALILAQKYYNQFHGR